ncbi:MAG: hypothetical protein HUU16_00530 [Candidatus Omnitrophica bacterium]|nr:hypothetical protein [bacterium]NUN94635.1 hypothetical protein [Candidatus Omnitrophota bacterium]
MRAEWRDRIVEVFQDIVGKQAFMLVECLDKEDLPAGGEEFRRAAVRLRGDIQGQLTVIVPVEMCKEIAANVLGIVSKENLAELRAEDSFVELVNVVCGHLATVLVGGERRARGALPELSTISRDEWREAQGDPDAIGFLVDDFPVLLTIAVEEASP